MKENPSIDWNAITNSREWVHCQILAVVISTHGFNVDVVREGKIAEGDWVTLTLADLKDGTYRTNLRGTWGVAGENYHLIIDLETGELQ